MSKKVIILVSILLIILAGVGVGVYQFNRGPITLEGKDAEFRISAEELLVAFEYNEDEANQKYLNRIISVEGTFSRFVEENQTITVVLESENLMSSVMCELQSGSEKITISKGDPIKIKGECTGYLMDVILVKSIIEE